MCAASFLSPSGRRGRAGRRRPRRRAVPARQRSQQDQRLQSMAALAAGITHDLNNVFAPIIISAELLRKTVPGEEAQQCLKILLQSAWQGSETLKQVLAFAGGMEGDLEAMRLADTVAELRQTLRQVLPPGVALEVEVSPDLWPICGDGVQLRQVILNLGRSGAGAMAKGGRLFIALKNTRVTPAMARSHPGAKAGPHVLMTVADTGRGIPARSLDRIFDPFFATNGSDLGHGLALSVVYGVVRSHGGFIRVHSEVGCGTEFEIFLPAQTRRTA